MSITYKKVYDDDEAYVIEYVHDAKNGENDVFHAVRVLPVVQQARDDRVPCTHRRQHHHGNE